MDLPQRLVRRSISGRLYREALGKWWLLLPCLTGIFYFHCIPASSGLAVPLSPLRSLGVAGGTG